MGWGSRLRYYHFSLIVFHVTAARWGIVTPPGNELDSHQNGCFCTWALRDFDRRSGWHVTHPESWRGGGEGGAGRVQARFFSRIFTSCRRILHGLFFESRCHELVVKLTAIKRMSNENICPECTSSKRKLFAKKEEKISSRIFFLRTGAEACPLRVRFVVVPNTLPSVGGLVCAEEWQFGPLNLVGIVQNHGYS